MITDDRALVLYLAKTGMWDLKWPGFEKNREKFIEKKMKKKLHMYGKLTNIVREG